MLVRVVDLPECVSEEVLSDFITNTVYYNENKRQLLMRFSDIYLYIVDSSISGIDIPRHEKWILQKHGYVILGFMLLCEDKFDDLLHAEKNSFILCEGTVDKNHKILERMIKHWESISETPIRYCLPFNIINNSTFWKAYFNSKYSIESLDDLFYFIDDRQIERYGANWQELINEY
mgnify:CR=1 FL=1